MKLDLSAERIAALCAPPPGYVKPAPQPPANPDALKKRRVKTKRQPHWKPVTRKPISRYQINKETIAKIQEWRKTNPWHSYREIAEHFKVSVSTAYYSLNRPKTNAS